MGKLVLLMSVVLASCATTELQMVPDSDYRSVPPTERTKVDNTSDTALAKARAELHSAAEAANAARARIATPVAAHKPAAADDDGAPAKSAALVRVDTAMRAQQQAELVWRERRVEAAQDQLAVIAGQRELARATAVDRYISGDEPYDVTPYRGQMAHAQDVWWAAVQRTESAYAELRRAGVTLTSAKEAYAQLMRADGQVAAAIDQGLAAAKPAAKQDAPAKRSTKLSSSK
jgi:hypothetical protein